MTSTIELADPLRHAFAGSAPVPAQRCYQRLVGAETFAGAGGMLSAHWLPAGSGIEDVATAESAVYLLAGSALRRTGAGGDHLMAPGDAVYYPPGAARSLRTPAENGALFLEASAAIDSAPPSPELARGHAADEGHLVGAVTDDGTGTLGADGGFAGMAVRWLVDQAGAGARYITLATSAFEPGGSHELHRHRGADEFFLVLAGGGEHLTAAGPLPIGAGVTVYIPRGEWHGFHTNPGVVTHAVYGYLGASSLDAAGYELLGQAVNG
jgi:quercetin dioxygenase-like cupin family protein